jgi:hypothetical protein
MRNKLAVTVLLIGMAGSASAQQYYQAGGTDTQLKTDAQQNDNSNNNSSPENNDRPKEQRKKPDRMPEKPSSSAPDQSSPEHKDCAQPQSSDEGPQNTIEYGG